MATRLFSRATPFGHLVGVALPHGDDAAALTALVAELPPQDGAHALSLAPARRATWAGGRVALHAALAEVGASASSIGATARGAPTLPAGFAGSISHKTTVAVALAARAAGGTTLGVDVELDRPRRIDLSDRVLTDEERRALGALPPEARPREILFSFAAKEAIYKALDPWVGRYVSFQEVELARVGDACIARLRLTAGEGPFAVEVHEEPQAGLILTMARLVPTAQ